MAATRAQIREGLRAAVAAQLGTTWQTFAYFKSTPKPPQIDILNGQTAYHRAMQNGKADLTFTVRALVPHTLEESAQTLLDMLLDTTGSSSMLLALEADPTLGGLVSDTTVTEASEVKSYTSPGQEPGAVGCEWTVEVIV